MKYFANQLTFRALVGDRKDIYRNAEKIQHWQQYQPASKRIVLKIMGGSLDYSRLTRRRTRKSIAKKKATETTPERTGEMNQDRTATEEMRFVAGKIGQNGIFPRTYRFDRWRPNGSRLCP
jgi:hypothetical protein